MCTFAITSYIRDARQHVVAE